MKYRIWMATYDMGDGETAARIYPTRDGLVNDMGLVVEDEWGSGGFGFDKHSTPVYFGTTVLDLTHYERVE